MLLTERERNVLKLVINGEDNHRIASMLGIKANTVKSYKTRIVFKYRYFGIKNLRELLKFYQKLKKENPELKFMNH